MFLYFNRQANQHITVTATEGRGTLNSAKITFEHLSTGETVTLTKTNQSAHRSRYDEFIIAAADIATLPEGDILYTIKAAPGGDIDDSLTLETGRGRIIETITETINTYTRTEEPVIYERTT